MDFNKKYKIKKHLDDDLKVVFGVSIYSPYIFFSRDVDGKKIFFRKSGYYFDLPRSTFIPTEGEAKELLKKLLECEEYNK